MTISIRRGVGRDRTTPLPDSDLLVLSTVSRTRAWTLTGLATIALATTLIHRQVLAALAVTVTSSLGISDVKYGWLSSGLAGAFLIGSLPGARFVQVIGPQLGLALTVAFTSLVIGMHSVVGSFAALLWLRIAMGFGAALSMPSAAQTIHRVLPFKDRSRGIGLLYLGSSLGSALCAPLAIMLESRFGWRGTFFWVAAIGIIWIPIWMFAALGGRRAVQADAASVRDCNQNVGTSEQVSSVNRRTGSRHFRGEWQVWHNPMGGSPVSRLSIIQLIRIPGVLRGSLLVAAAAPITLVMLIWAAKYMVATHKVPQRHLGEYLWLPALLFGLGSLLFGELRARSAKTRASARPPRVLVAQATLLCAIFAFVPFAYGPVACVAIASVAMLGAGGLYTLATSDMLAHTPRQSVPSTTGFTTLVQSLIYIVMSPIIGKCVEYFGNYDWVMIGSGLWVLPFTVFWLLEATIR